MITNQGYDHQDTLTITLKNGNEKKRTVFQWACVKVRQYIYSNRSIENNGKYVYIEDLSKDSDIDGDTALDREYIRMGKYDGIDTYHDYTQYNEILKSLNLTLNQQRIIKLRMQGMGVTDIAKKLEVDKSTISKQLMRIRERVISLYPDMIRHFDMNYHNYFRPLMAVIFIQFYIKPLIL